MVSLYSLIPRWASRGTSLYPQTHKQYMMKSSLRQGGPEALNIYITLLQSNLLYDLLTLTTSQGICYLPTGLRGEAARRRSCDKCAISTWSQCVWTKLLWPHPRTRSWTRMILHSYQSSGSVFTTPSRAPAHSRMTLSRTPCRSVNQLMDAHPPSNPVTRTTSYVVICRAGI
jgi:hypothetical protein